MITLIFYSGIHEDRNQLCTYAVNTVDLEVTQKDFADLHTMLMNLDPDADGSVEFPTQISISKRHTGVL